MGQNSSTDQNKIVILFLENCRTATQRVTGARRGRASVLTIATTPCVCFYNDGSSTTVKKKQERGVIMILYSFNVSIIVRNGASTFERKTAKITV